MHFNDENSAISTLVPFLSTYWILAALHFLLKFLSAAAYTEAVCFCGLYFKELNWRELIFLPNAIEREAEGGQAKPLHY